MAEWSIAAVLKTVEGNTSGGSNPSLSAELTGQNRTVSRQVPQIQWFVGLFYSLVSALKYTFSPQKDKVRNLTRTGSADFSGG